MQKPLKFERQMKLVIFVVTTLSVSTLLVEEFQIIRRTKPDHE